MEKRLDNLSSKMDKVIDKISSIDSTLAAQHVSLQIHIKKTELLEKRMEKSESSINKAIGAIKLTLSTGTLFAIAKVISKFV